MRIIPTKLQWQKWSLPTKIGILLGIIGILLAILIFSYVEFIKPDYSKLSYNIAKRFKQEEISEKDLNELIYRVEKDLNQKIDPNIWNEYANSIISIYEGVDSTAKIKLNEKIFCDLTKKSQIVDISIHSKIAGHKILVAVKLLPIKDQVNLDMIRYFSLILKDINASKGVIISNAEYNNEVIKFAKEHMIDLCKLKDASSRKWSDDISIPVIWKDIKPILQVNMSFNLVKGDRFHNDLGRALFSNDNGLTTFTLGDYFVEKWNKNMIPHNTKELFIIENEFKNLKIKIKKDWRSISDFYIAYEVKSESFLKYFVPIKFKAIENFITKDTQVSELDIGISPFENDGTWQKIDFGNLNLNGLIIIATVKDLTLNNDAIIFNNLSIREAN